MNNERTLNNPGYLSAVSSNYDEPVFFNEETVNNRYNSITRNGYNSLGNNRRRLSSEHYGFAPENPADINNTTNTRINSYYYPEVINKLDLILPPDWFECFRP